MVKMIISDMDGTLLNGAMKISEENSKAIKAAQNKGIEFMVATGRDRGAAAAPLQEAGIDCAMITLNGAQIFDRNGETLSAVEISKEKMRKMLAILDEHDVYYEVFTTDDIYSSSQAARVESFATELSAHMPHLTYKTAIAMASANIAMWDIAYTDDMHKLIEEDKQFLKLFCFHKDGPNVLGPVAKKLEELGDIVVSSSGAHNLEVNHKNAQKGIAVASVAQERHVSLDDIMTIGDNFNDVSMLELAGVSFAMGNASVEVKEYAKYVTDTNLESGVAKAIYQVLDKM